MLRNNINVLTILTVSGFMFGSNIAAALLLWIVVAKLTGRA